MALTKCTECGHKVATTAASCPSCGHAGPFVVPKRKTSPVTWLVLVLIVGVVISALLSGPTSRSPDPAAASATKKPDPAALARANEKRAREKQEREVSARAYAGAKLLRDNMRNPATFALESALAIESTKAICYEYRAQNGFGGMNRERALLTAKDQIVTSGMAGFAGKWNAQCANKDGSEYASAIKTLL